MNNSTIVVLDFEREIRTAAGAPAGTRRGWMPTEELEQAGLPVGARVVARTDDPKEVQALVLEADCAFAQAFLPRLVQHVAAGGKPADLHQKVHAHLAICEVCQAAYQAQIEQIREKEV